MKHISDPIRLPTGLHGSHSHGVIESTIRDMDGGTVLRIFKVYVVAILSWLAVAVRDSSSSTNTTPKF